MSTKKIDKLTPAQELLVPIYLNKWLKIGRSTERINKERAIEAVKTIYRVSGRKEPSQFFFFDSPLQCQLAVAAAKANADSSLKATKKDTDTPFMQKLVGNMKSMFGASAGASINEKDLEAQVKNSLEKNFKVQYEYSMYVNYWCGWVGFFDFLLNELFPEKIAEYGDFVAYTKAVQELHVIIPFEDVVFISDRPTSLHLDAQGRQHHETQASMAYSDGYSLYNLNGITVPKWVVETPKEQIDPKMVLGLTNTEQRMAVMRFVGLSKFLSNLGAELKHESNGYKLYHLNVESTVVGPYLYMKCPSSGREFLEGVGNPDKYENLDTSITTCEDALKWRLEKASNNLMTKFNNPEKWSMRA